MPFFIVSLCHASVLRNWNAAFGLESGFCVPRTRPDNEQCRIVALKKKLKLNAKFPIENQQTIKSGLFWTAGTDEGSEGNFAFADSKEFLPRTAKC
jgi:hypothetical protein